MNTNRLLNTSMMTPMERAAGRFMRAPDHPGGDGTGGGGTNPGGDGNNTGENPGDTGNPGESGNNDGQAGDLASFWNNPDSNQEGNDGTPTPEQFANQFKEAYQGIQLPNVMTPELAQELGEGKFDNFNANLNSAMQAGIKQAIQLSMMVMKQANLGLLAQVKGMMSESFNSREAEADLLAAIPSAKNPAVKPIVDQIFQQALALNKGNRQKAIQQTKQMMTLTLQTTSADLGIPPNSADGGPAKTDWIQELLGK